MVRTISLLSYLPHFLREYKELAKILEVEEEEIELLFYELERTRENQFISYCDTVGIARFEELLGLEPNVYDSLEARILRVLARWVDDTPYTFAGLIAKLNSIFGEGNYELVTDFLNYQMQIHISTMLSSQIEILEELFLRMIPANILTEIYNMAERELTNELRFGGVLTRHKKREFDVLFYHDAVRELTNDFYVGQVSTVLRKESFICE